MTTSIETRIKFIIGIALTLVGLMGALTLYYFSALNTNIELLIGTDIKNDREAQGLKSAFHDLKNAEREYLYFLRAGLPQDQAGKGTKKLHEKWQGFFTVIAKNKKQNPGDDILSQLDLLEANLKEYLAVIETVLSGPSESSNVNQIEETLVNLRDKQDEIINLVLSASAQNFISHQEYIDHLISNANRNLVLIVTIALLAGGLIIYLAPQRVTRPIRNYISAICELRELKFDTRLPVNEKNELSELGNEINKFVEAFVDFDEMKRKKIQFEKRKLQVLSDILNLGVVTISIEGEVLSLNAQMAKFLNLSTESFQKKDFHFVRLPQELKDLFEDAIRKKEKFENRMIVLTYQKQEENGEAHEEAVELLVDAGMVRNYMGDVANIILTFEDISNTPKDSIFKRISFAKQAVA